ncbi:fasciclin domain-containing protein [Modestobacter lapidis]|nr:fasciclin domain-containing protein [Modestobacter lapidis]
MSSPRRYRSIVLAGAAGLALTMTACGSDDTSAAEGTTSSAAESTSSTPEATEATEATPASDAPFGPACSQVPTEGEGSVAGMADDPVATAASNNPLLSTLVTAVTQANLVDALNSAEDVTVLAPANPAFEAVPADALNALLADQAQLTTVLTSHVIPGRLAPDELAGEHTTLAGGTVTIEGSGEDFTLTADQTVVGSAPASVICGNVQTANATVYLIDQVLAPAAG